MRVLILGGAGFVGTNLRRRLREKHSVVICDRERTDPEPDDCEYIRGDISDYLSMRRVFSAAKPDHVFHLAGMVSRRECEETPTLAFQTNTIGTYNVCSLCQEHGARIIYSGSSEEYGKGFSGQRVSESSSFGPATGIYSLTKRFAEEVVQHFSYAKGLKATVTRFFMLYGPGEPFNEYRSAVIRFVNLAMANKPLPVHFGTSRSWCHIDDAVRALELILDRAQECDYEVYNIGRDAPIATEALAREIIHMSGSKSVIRKTVPDPTIIPDKVADFSHIKSVLGWEAQIGLEDGLRSVVQYERERDR